MFGVYRTPTSTTTRINTESSWERFFKYIERATIWATSQCTTNYVVVAGDLNAKHKTWGGITEGDVNGNSLYLQLQRYPQFQILNNGKLTRYPQGNQHGRPSAIDLTLVIEVEADEEMDQVDEDESGDEENEDKYDYFDWKIIDEKPIESDHEPISFRIPFQTYNTVEPANVEARKQRRQGKPRLKRYLDWKTQDKIDQFQVALTTALESKRREGNVQACNLWSLDTDQIAKELAEILIVVANKQLRLSMSDYEQAREQDAHSAWNAECSLLLSEKKVLNQKLKAVMSQRWKTNQTIALDEDDTALLDSELAFLRSEKRVQGKKLKREIWKARMEALGQGLDGINFRRSNGKVWELVKSLDGQPSRQQQGKRSHEICRRGLSHNNTVTHEANEIANVLAKHYANTNTPALDEEMISIGKRIDRRKFRLQQQQQEEGEEEEEDEEEDKAHTTTADYIEESRKATRLHYQQIQNRIASAPRILEQEIPEKGLNSRIRCDEVRASLPTRDKVNTSPGPDGVTKRLILTAGEPLVEILTDLANLMLMTGSFPSSWKTAVVNPLAKVSIRQSKLVLPNKTRPISLLSDISKVLETVLEKRLRSFLESQSNPDVKLAKRQFGFRNNHRTEDVLVHLVNNIREGWQRRQCTILLQLDAHKAYDKVWIPHIVSQLFRALGDGLLFRLLFSFLTDRTLRVKVDNELSELVSLVAGLAQGSSINPLMYVVDVNAEVAQIDEANKDHPSTDGGGFADDIFLTTTAMDPRPDCRWEGGTPVYSSDAALRKVANLQQLVDNLVISAAIAGRRYDANMDKINCTVFFRPSGYKDFDETRNVTALAELPPLFLVDKEVQKTVDTITILGLKLDSALTFKPYIDYCIARASSRLNVVNRLTGPRYQTEISTLRTLYQAWIAPLLTYCSPAWSNISQQEMARLSDFEAKAAKIILGATFLSARASLIDELNILPIQFRIIAATVKYYQRAIRLSNNHLIGSDYSRWKHIHKSHLITPNDYNGNVGENRFFEFDKTILIDKIAADTLTNWNSFRVIYGMDVRRRPNKRVVDRSTTLVFDVLYMAAITLFMTEESMGPSEEMSITDVRQPWLNCPTRGISAKVTDAPNWPVFGPASSRSVEQKKAAQEYAVAMEQKLMKEHKRSGWVIYTDGAVRTAYAKSIIRPYQNGWKRQDGKWCSSMGRGHRNNPGRSHFADKTAGSGAAIWSGPENGFRAKVRYPLGRYHYSGTSELFGPILVMEDILSKIRWRNAFMEQHISILTIVLDNQWIVQVLSQKTLKQQPVNTPILPELFQALDRIIAAEIQLKAMMKVHKDIELKINYVWIPGHTDDHGKGGCIGNVHADRLAEQACNDVIRHGKRFGLAQPGLGSNHMKIPYHMTKPEISRRLTIRWRSKRWSTLRSSASDEWYLDHNVFWSGSTHNWALEDALLPRRPNDDQDGGNDDEKQKDSSCFSEEARWASPPRVLIINQSRKRQVLITRIRLGIAPTNHTLARRFPDISQSVFCMEPCCLGGQYVDSANHRLFECPKQDTHRMALLPKIREILGIKNVLPYSPDWIQDKDLSNAMWTWKIMVCHSYIHVPTFLKHFVKNFRINFEVCKEMANVFFTFLHLTKLEVFFGIRMSTMIQLQDDIRTFDQAILIEQDVAKIHALHAEKQALRTAMLGYG
jgi:hypothetical protein